MRRLTVPTILLLGLVVGLIVTRANSEPPGGLEVVQIPNATAFSETVLVGGQPTLADLDRAAESGYTTVINLRAEGEFSEWDEASEATSRGLRYVSIPVEGAVGVTRENAARLREELERAAGGPVLLHCASGNRVGALLALSAYHFDGEDAQAALEIGLAGGLMSLEPAVAEYLASQEGR